MAATFAIRPAEGFNAPKVPGGYLVAVVEITAGSADYAAGGYAFGLAQLQTLLTAALFIDRVNVVNDWGTDGGVTAALARFDRTNNKVQAFGMAAAAGVGTGFTEMSAGAAAMNGLKCSLEVWYR